MNTAEKKWVMIPKEVWDEFIREHNHSIATIESSKSSERLWSLGSMLRKLRMSGQVMTDDELKGK